MKEQQMQIDRSMLRRKSGLIVPENTPPETCPHILVERGRRKDKCRTCGQRVFLVRIKEEWMTQEEMSQFHRNGHV